MALPKEMVEDMATNVAALRKEDLEFFVIPQKKVDEPAWLLIDTTNRIRPRFSGARQAVKKAQGFALQRMVSGRVQVTKRRLYLILEDDAPFALQAKLRTKWSKAWAEEEGLDKFAALCKRATVLTEAEAVAHDFAADDAVADEGDDTKVAYAELAAFLGPDADEATSVAADLSELNEALLGVAFTAAPGAQETQKLAEQLTALRGSPNAVDRLVDLAPVFLKMVQSETPLDPRPLAVGGKVRPKDQLLGLGLELTQYQNAVQAWAAHVRIAESAQAEIDRLQAPQELDDDAREDLERWLDQYETSRVAGVRAEERADALREALEAAIDTFCASTARD